MKFTRLAHAASLALGRDQSDGQRRTVLRVLADQLERVRDSALSF